MALFYIEELNKFTRTQRYDMVNMKVGYQVTTLLANWLRVQTMSMHCNERKKVHINMKTSPICNGPFDGNTQALRVYNQMVMRSYPSTTSGSRGSCHTWIFSSHYDAAQSPERLTRSPLPPSNKRRWTWTDGEEKPETQWIQTWEARNRQWNKMCGTYSLVTLLNRTLYQSGVWQNS